MGLSMLISSFLSDQTFQVPVGATLFDPHDQAIGGSTG